MLKQQVDIIKVLHNNFLFGVGRKYELNLPGNTIQLQHNFNKAKHQPA